MKREKKILVVNPASNVEMTERIDATLDPFRALSGLEIVCSTALDGPRAVATDADVAAAVLVLRAMVARESADVVILACYADPGLKTCREATEAVVLGAGRCAALAALARADNFGVIAMSEQAIPRHLRALRLAGLDPFLAGERALPAGEGGLEKGLVRLIEAGRALRDEDGARAVVIGCAELGALRAPLEDALGVPVIDPVEAAMGVAMTILAAGAR